jgi:hypothetical protein
MQLARGEILAFTDADCIPDQDWLTAGESKLAENPSYGFLGGRVEIFPADDARPNSVELYDMIFGLNQHTCITKYGYAVTANLIARRSTMDQVGGFDSQLKSLGDSEWGRRATSKNYSGLYVEEVLVRHPARRHWKNLLSQARRFAGGRADLNRDNPYRKRIKTWHFWRMMVRHTFPHVTRMNYARSQLRASGYGLGAWLRVVFVILVVQYTLLWERVRKLCGLPSERR